MLTRGDLRHYQVFFVEKIKRCFAADRSVRLPGLILALEPGAGKTGLVLTALRDLFDTFTIRKALIVAPLLVAQTVWPAEMDEWEHLRALTWTLIRVEEDDPEVLAAGQAAYDEALARYQAEVEEARQELLDLGLGKKFARADARSGFDKSPAARAEKDRQVAAAAAKEAKLRRLLAEDTEIHIINKQALPWLWSTLREGRDWPYEVLITDDLREGRSGKKRSKGSVKDDKKGPAPLSRFGVLARARKRVMATIQLTGTPTPKGLENLWGLSYLIDLGERLGETKFDFDTRWFTKNKYTFEIKPRPKAFEQIMDAVKDIMFSLSPEDIGELPEFVVRPIRVRLPAQVLAAYRKFEEQMVSEEYDVEAVNGGVLHGKLLQFANGSMYQEDGGDVFVHDLKIEALKELVERMDGEPLLVLYTYQFDIDRIKAAFPKATVLRPDNAVQVVKDWNANKIEMLLAHRESAGHGLNMQKGIGHMCEYGLTSDAELFLQAKKRLHRPGRKTTVVNHVIIAEGTIDEDVYPMYLDPKIETQEQILEAVRVRVSDFGAAR